jgi:hypothetical protein
MDFLLIHLLGKVKNFFGGHEIRTSEERCINCNKDIAKETRPFKNLWFGTNTPPTV